MKKIILAGLLCCISQMGHSASFNCEKAAGFVELTICSTPALSAMDSQLNALYNQLLQQQPENKALLRKSQLSWLKDIRNKATTIESLQTAYQSRIQDLQTLLGHNTAPEQAKPDPAPVAPQPAPVAPQPAPVAAKSELEMKAEEAKYRNGYTAIVTCGPVTAPGYVDNCFNDSDLKITKDNITTLYNMSSGNFPSTAGEAFSDGLHIKLPESFSVYAQNSMDNDVLMVKIVKNDSGKVVFQDQASKYGVISVRN